MEWYYRRKKARYMVAGFLASLSRINRRLEMASFEQVLRVHPMHQTSFDKHKGFTLLHMGTEPHCVRAFYFPMFVRSLFVIESPDNNEKS
ncbi:hypothetical protein L2748_07350, partial [Shewanella sairae]|uniref:hypothetical protein n=1 Tax=Shewanella sairae TaxID=190310 RepID=UPI00200D9C2B